MSREDFKNLVENCAKELELNYDYCRLAFSYFGGNKKNKKYVQKDKSTEHLQTVFSLENKIFTQAEILK